MTNSKFLISLMSIKNARRVGFALAALFVLNCASTRAQQSTDPPAVFGTAATSGATSTDAMIGIPGTFAIRNARIVTVAGAEIPNGTIVISDGKIAAVGADAQVPAGATEINAQGLSVYPGMIDAGTTLGLVEVGNGAPGTVDTAEVGEMNPNAQAIIAVNPHSAHVAVTRVNGVTTVVTAPRGGVIAGQAALINLLGTEPRDMAVIPNVALVINFPRLVGGARGEGFFNQPTTPLDITAARTARDRQADVLRRILRDAEAYGRAQDAYAKDQTLPRPATNVVLAALVPYVRGERPVIFNVDREADIRAVVAFASEMKLRAIIMGGEEAWKAASLLKERNVPVILTGTLNLPRREDDFYDVNYSSAAKLAQAGVRFCISTGDTGAHVRDLPYHAGMAAAFGLAPSEALKAVTIYPAQIFGIADRLGSIEVGKTANLVVTDGDLLEARTNIRYLFINGRQVPLVSRHTELYEQFKNRKH
jgi:imidazolonepropionase-like amidohydrolase